MPIAFVTGGTGFVGLNLINQLLAENWKVVALHRPTANLRHLREKGIQFVEGSVTEPESLINVFLPLHLPGVPVQSLDYPIT